MLVSGRVLLGFLEAIFLLMNSQCSASRTGSGKTHTIFGPPGVLTEHEYHQGAVLTKNHVAEWSNPKKCGVKPKKSPQSTWI